MELVILGVFLMFGSGACQLKNVTECNDAEIEACGEQFVAFAHGPHVAETLSELEESCRLVLKGLACARNYAERCLVGFFRGAAFTALIRLKEEMDRKCDSSHPNHKRYLAGAHCLNRAGDRIHECYQTFKEELYRIIVGATAERRLEHGCCETGRLFYCKQRSIEQACGDAYTEQPVPGSFERSFGELVTLYCLPYEHGSPHCAALDELPKLAPNETVPRSLVLLMKSYASAFG